MVSRAGERRTVILAAGDFPARGSEPERLLRAATRVIACDSAAAAYRRRFHRWPDVIVGDLDSFDAGGDADAQRRCVRVAEQETNDLDKALALCRADDPSGWRDATVIVGATGKREDHTIGNVYRALAAEVPVVSEHGTFWPVRGRLTVRTRKDAGISVFAPDPETRMTSRGLRWELDSVRFTTPFCATLNRAASETVSVTSTRPAFVYVARDPAAVRAVVSLGSNVGNRERRARDGAGGRAARIRRAEVPQPGGGLRDDARAADFRARDARNRRPPWPCADCSERAAHDRP